MSATIETTPGHVEPAALYERAGHVAVIRPHALNAVNAALSTAVGETLERATDPEVRVAHRVRREAIAGLGRPVSGRRPPVSAAQGLAVHDRKG